MTHFYINNGNLYSSDIEINGQGFVEITEEEYNIKLTTLVANREIGLPNNFEDYPF